MANVLDSWWSTEVNALAEALGSSPAGLTADAARARAGRSRAMASHRVRPIKIFISQFTNPMVLVLIAAAFVSLAVGSVEDGVIVLGIVVASGLVGFVQEYRAEDAVAKLRELVRMNVTVLRDGAAIEIGVAEVVPGDVVCLGVGSYIPADARVLTSNGLQTDESALTGESFPSEKGPAPCATDAQTSQRSSAVFLGTHVVSGTGTAIVVRTGAETELGHLAARLEKTRPPTDFAIGLQRFGMLLVQATAALVIAIFALNVMLHRPALSSFLFSVALAVGLVPELLPAIVTVNLASGARRMAERGVVVKHLPSIESFGAVTVLCSDKTGTLTAGKIRLDAALDIGGQPSARVGSVAWLNANFESGYASPLDEAIRSAIAGDAAGWTRVDEIAYDFHRKRLSVVLSGHGKPRWLVTKGQLASVLSVCTSWELPTGEVVPFDADARATIAALHERLASQGRRLLGVAVRDLPERVADAPYTRDDEAELCLIGLLSFADPAKPDVPEVLRTLDEMGVTTKVITGDDHRVARRLWEELRGRPPELLTGQELRRISPAALGARARAIDVFAEVEPDQKEQIVLALRRSGHAVAYLGDGINDAAALHAADVGVSVDSAADVAREAADIVLAQPDLAVLADGIREGRKTMARTLAYVRYTTSANFGNMLSMAVASLALPFLPLLPKQILLNNLLSDVPAIAMAGDAVDPALLREPGRWEMSGIRKFMLVFGAISSVFDIATFGLLYWLTSADEVSFQSGWFVESLLTELFVVFAMRSPRPMGTDRPSPLLTGLVVGSGVVAFILPYTPLAPLLGLAPLAASVAVSVAAVTAAYVGVTELVKRWFFRQQNEPRA
jgi:Mg2+-importing ATPase